MSDRPALQAVATSLGSSASRTRRPHLLFTQQRGERQTGELLSDFVAKHNSQNFLKRENQTEEVTLWMKLVLGPPGAWRASHFQDVVRDVHADVSRGAGGAGRGTG